MTAAPTPACSAATLRTPGPGRDTRQTDPAATAGAEDPEATAAMSDTDLDRTRLGSHEPGPARH